MEIDANSGVNTVRIRRLEEDMERTRRTKETLQQQLAASRAGILELRARQRAQDRHLQEVFRQVSDLRAHPGNSHRR